MLNEQLVASVTLPIYKTHDISFDKYFMLIAEVIKIRSTCLRKHVGCVIVREDRIIATGNWI